MNMFRRTLALVVVTAAISMIGTSLGIAFERIAYCDNQRLADPTGQRHGDVDYKGAALRYRSQVESTNTSRLYEFRYCIENDNAFWPVVVLWQEQNPRKTVFFGSVAQQAKRAQFHDSIFPFKDTNAQLNYGPSKNSWDGTPSIDTIFHKSEEKIPRLVQLVQFTNAQGQRDIPETLKSYDELKRALDKGAKINLRSGAIVDIPTTQAAAAYLNGETKTPPKDRIEFVTVEIRFSSNLERTQGYYRVRNVGSFITQNPEALAKTMAVTGKTQFVIDKNSINRLGKIEERNGSPLYKTPEGGPWLVAQQNIKNAIEQASGEITIRGPSQQPIAAFPFNFFALKRQ